MNGRVVLFDAASKVHIPMPAWVPIVTWLALLGLVAAVDQELEPFGDCGNGSVRRG